MPTADADADADGVAWPLDVRLSRCSGTLHRTGDASSG
jgi:hypothetical protein